MYNPWSWSPSCKTSEHHLMHCLFKRVLFCLPFFHFQLYHFQFLYSRNFFKLFFLQPYPRPLLKRFYSTIVATRAFCNFLHFPSNCQIFSRGSDGYISYFWLWMGLVLPGLSCKDRSFQIFLRPHFLLIHLVNVLCFFTLIAFFLMLQRNVFLLFGFASFQNAKFLHTFELHQDHLNYVYHITTSSFVCANALVQPQCHTKNRQNFDAYITLESFVN